MATVSIIIENAGRYVTGDPRLDELIVYPQVLMAHSSQRPSVTAAVLLLEKMGKMRYFGSPSYEAWQPQPLDRLFQEDGWASAPIKLLTESGLVRLEYTKDQSVHPRDLPDLWRLVLLPRGAEVLEKAGIEFDPALVDRTT